MQWSAVWLAVNHWNKISLDLSVENAGWQVTKMSMIYLSVCVTSCIQIFGLSSTWTQNEIKQQQKKSLLSIPEELKRSVKAILGSTPKSPLCRLRYLRVVKCLLASLPKYLLRAQACGNLSEFTGRHFINKDIPVLSR